MDLSKSYSVLYVVMFLVHFGDTTSTNSEVKYKTIWEHSRSHENDHSLLTRSETNLGDQNTARYLFRRSINKSGNKTIDSDKGLQINSTTDDNSTAMKLTGGIL